ncbi:MAG: HAD-IIIC family phosphatase [Methanosarcinales archaeon]
MDKNTCKGLLISDFNLQNFAGLLNNDIELPRVQASLAPFGEVQSVLIQNDSRVWGCNPDFALIWTQPDNVSESFSRILRYEEIPVKKALKEVDEFSSLLINACERVKFALIPTWVSSTRYRAFSLLDLKPNIGMTNTLMHMNMRLAENLDKVSSFYLLNTQRWIEVAGKKAFNSKLWYMGKIAFGNDVFKEAVLDVKSAIKGIKGDSVKLIIVDLDDTIWGGIVGEVGWQNIRLGGHDHIGEAFVDFQRSLKALKNLGIILGIVSKNEESVALEAISKHPEMVLRLEDFAGWRINWNDKPQNILDLASELNLGLKSVIFIDDNPVERARVRDALPEVIVPEWPEDKMLYKSALLNLRYFNSPSISLEDKNKTQMYKSERQRQQLKKSISSQAGWLKNLKIKVKIEELNDGNLKRTVQLLNKTNQMNLTTRRMTEQELKSWAKKKNHKLWTFSVCDKYGDSGLTGIVSLEINGRNARIVDFVLSCRVFGRKIEDIMLHKVIEYSRNAGLKELRAKYISTPKNKPCLDFLKDSIFHFDKKLNLFVLDLNINYSFLPYIEIQGQD